jgi:AraC family transcriptional regulator
MDSAVERAAAYMWERYAEPLSLDDIARSAIFSKFHFCRSFGSATGVSPGRFLAAVRMFQAKRLLLSTDMNVTDISMAVGYSSLGSFINHFTASVGVSPGRFRRVAESGGLALPAPRSGDAGEAGTVSGVIVLPEDYRVASVCAGVFSTPIVQGQPVSAAMVTIESAGRPHAVRLENVPAGTWFVHAVAVADSSDHGPWTTRTQLTGTCARVRVTAGARSVAIIPLRPRRPADLPVLLALPDLEPALDALSTPGPTERPRAIAAPRPAHPWAMPPSAASAAPRPRSRWRQEQ